MSRGSSANPATTSASGDAHSSNQNNYVVLQLYHRCSMYLVGTKLARDLWFYQAWRKHRKDICYFINRVERYNKQHRKDTNRLKNWMFDETLEHRALLGPVAFSRLS